MEDKREEILRFRVTAAEKDQIVAKMAVEGVPLSAFLRAAALEKAIQVKSNEGQLPKKRDEPSIFREDKKSETVRFKVTPKEKEWVVGVAQQADMELSAYMRVIMNQQSFTVLDTKMLKKLLYELQKVGANLNQLLVLCHQGKVHYPKIDDVIEIQQQLLKAFLELTAQMKTKQQSNKATKQQSNKAIV